MSPNAGIELSEFDDIFFASFEQDFSEANLQVLATEALGDILTVEGEDGTTKTYESILEEADRFFSNELVQRDMKILDATAAQFAQFVQQHNCGLEGAGANALNAFGHGLDMLHSHPGHAGDLDDDDDEG